MKLIVDCHSQLRPGAYMVFVTISKSDARYREGEALSQDRIETRHAVQLFFYDSDS